jgi:hypothetical protein
MTHVSKDTQRPTEWLQKLQEDDRAYQRLLTECGSLAHAAYRLARARCLVREVASGVPTLQELQSAAVTIARHVGSPTTLPIASLLASECEHAGLPVIHPVPAATPRAYLPPSESRIQSR